jgi:hypothetical protein
MPETDFKRDEFPSHIWPMDRETQKRTARWINVVKVGLLIGIVLGCYLIRSLK